MNLLLVLIASAMMMGAGFVVNQIYDADSDRINNKLFFLAHGVVPLRGAVLEAILLLVGSLMLAWVVSEIMLILFIIAAFLFTVVYNMPPFVLKDRVLGSFFANALMGILAFAYGWYVVDSRFSVFASALLPYVLFNTGLYFLTTIPDVPGDGHARKKTISVVYGVQTTIRWAVAFEVSAILFGFVGWDPIILIPALLVSPWYAVLLFRSDRSTVIRTIKWGLFLFSLIVGTFFPLFLLLIGFFFFFTRWYYQKRFNMDYPNFKGA